RRSTLESPLSLTSTTPGTEASASRSCGVAERRKVVWNVDVSAPRERSRTEPWTKRSPWFRSAPSSHTSWPSRRRRELMNSVRPPPREVSVELRRLNHRTDARGGTGRLPAHLDGEEDGAAPRRSDQVCHDLDRRGLSRAVRTEEPEGRALRDGEIEGLQGREVTVLLAQPLQVNRDFAGD